MTEGLFKRMSRIVGDENTVARYLLEKIGHTALIAWTLAHVLFEDSLDAAVVAALAYLIIGKALWFYGARKRSQQARTHLEFLHGDVIVPPAFFLDDAGRAVRFWPSVADILFDLWVGLFPAVVALWWIEPRFMLSTACIWFVGVAIGSNNQWGSPS
jgi:hypothetical protein